MPLIHDPAIRWMVEVCWGLQFGVRFLQNRRWISCQVSLRPLHPTIDFHRLFGKFDAERWHPAVSKATTSTKMKALILEMSKLLAAIYCEYLLLRPRPRQLAGISTARILTDAEQF